MIHLLISTNPNAAVHPACRKLAEGDTVSSSLEETTCKDCLVFIKDRYLFKVAHLSQEIEHYNYLISQISDCLDNLAPIDTQLLIED